MNIEEDFMNLGWICIDNIKEEILHETLYLKTAKTATWEVGYELIINAFDEQLILNFKIENWDFLVSKYFFKDFEFLKRKMNKLSQQSSQVKAFAIDAWSNYYCYSKSIKGESIRLWNINDEDEINEGNITEEEKAVVDTELANRVLELANQTTVEFEKVQAYLNKHEVRILK